MTDSPRTNSGAAGADASSVARVPPDPADRQAVGRVDRRRPGGGGGRARHPPRQPHARRRRRLAQDARLRARATGAPARHPLGRRARRRLEPLRRPRHPRGGLGHRAAARGSSTAFLDPFAPLPTLVLLCGHAGRDGAPLPQSPDTIVRAAYERAARARPGVELQALGEVEYFLGKRPEESDIYGADERGYHASSPFVFGEALRREAMVAAGGHRRARSSTATARWATSQAAEADARIWEQHEIELALHAAAARPPTRCCSRSGCCATSRTSGHALQLRADPAQGARRQRAALPLLAASSTASTGRHATRTATLDGAGALADRRAGAARRRADGVRQPRARARSCA